MTHVPQQEEEESSRRTSVTTCLYIPVHATADKYNLKSHTSQGVSEDTHKRLKLKPEVSQTHDFLLNLI